MPRPETCTAVAEILLSKELEEYSGGGEFLFSTGEDAIEVRLLEEFILACTCDTVVGFILYK